MCLIAFAWQADAEFPLIVGANRDEWHDRPAVPAGWWQDHPNILAGRDLKAGGTWLGVTRSGRFAALTNFRDPSDRKTDAPSRGALVLDFLSGELSPYRYLRELRKTADHYQGFNLLLGDLESLFYFSSRIGEILGVPPGVHALSNHTLNEPWPKVESAKSALEAALRAKVPWEARQMAIYNLLSSEDRPVDSALPDTGVGLEWERVLSPPLIVTDAYGTRCSIVLTVDATHHLQFTEYTRDRTGGVTNTAAFSVPLR
ncbi:MAG: NRDE family protein [Betaproteobacteria bacterium]|nr:NRDE family protein [Betaproteobacteria bacterium]